MVNSQSKKRTINQSTIEGFNKNICAKPFQTQNKSTVKSEK